MVSIDGWREGERECEWGKGEEGGVCVSKRERAARTVALADVSEKRSTLGIFHDPIDGWM